MKIGDIVSIDKQGRFKNDIQLSDYKHPELNKSLLECYIFTTSAPDKFGQASKQVSSLKLLDEIRDSFLNNRIENRFTVIANYGHGKSHLALALTNYFSKPADSPEVRILLSRIEHSLNNPAKMTGYTQFKQSRGEFLVVHLRGDLPSRLREQFLIGLEESLKEHPASKDIQLPFWYKNAERYLSEFSVAQLEKANNFLLDYSTDVPSLRGDIRKEGKLTLCKDLFTHLNGVPPDLGQETSLKEAVEWVAEDLCGEGKSFGGLLVLFDEFSLFVQRYTNVGPNNDLQDLLNGISDHKSKTVFVAFAQHDPIAIAEASTSSLSRLANVKKELTRLPTNKKYALYSLMEGVVDSYLRQSDSAYKKFLELPRVKGAVRGEGASGITWDNFNWRYSEELNWDYDKFQEVVVDGCYPLHPFTTALLCTHQFEQGASEAAARTVLGFVMDQITQLQDQPVWVNDQVNWILPISLVDYFENRISKEDYSNYQNTLEMLGNEITSIQQKVLKALLLQEVSQLSATGSNQFNLISQMAGISYAQAKFELKNLAGNNIIRFDKNRKISTFWPSHTNPQKLEEMIREKLDNQKFDKHSLDELNEKYCKPIPVEVKWGDSDDWAADQRILTPDFFTSEKLKELIHPFRIGSKGIEESPRGLIVWLAACDEQDLEWFRENSNKLIQQAFPEETPIPVILVLPNTPQPNLFDIFRRILVLKKLTQNERKDVGIETYQREVELTDDRFEIELAKLFGDDIHYLSIIREPSQLIVPTPYRTSINVIKNLSIDSALRELYRLAYRYSPPGFFTQYSSKSSRILKNTIKKIVPWLLKDKVGEALGLSSASSVEKDLCVKYLFSEWGLLSAGTYLIQKPTSHIILEVWEQIDEAFKPGSTDVKVDQVLVTLVNPPFGFCCNTLSLLFSAWIGFNIHDLQININGRAVSLSDFEEKFNQTKNAKEFINLLCYAEPMQISRKNPEQIRSEVDAIIDRVKNGPIFTQKEAQDAIVILNEMTDASHYNERESTKAEEFALKLEKALELAQCYDESANRIKNALGSEKEIIQLLKLQDEFKKMTAHDLVEPTTPSIEELNQRWYGWLKEVVENECQRLENIRFLQDMNLYKKQLDEYQKVLNKKHLSELSNRVEQAIKNLSEKAQKIARREQEESLRSEIRSMTPSANLINLYEYKKSLIQFDHCTPETLKFRDGRLNEIEESISKLENEAKSLPKEFELISDNQSFIKWRERLFLVLHKFEETKFEDKIAELKIRSDNLSKLFSDLNPLQQSRVRTPQDYEDYCKQLEIIKNRYESQLSSSQLFLFDKVKDTWDNQIQLLTKQAHQWLQECYRTAQDESKILELSRALDSPPAFLQKDDEESILLLKNKVQNYLDKNVILEIEHKFRQINDPQKQIECLSRLQKLVDKKA
jgi:hypothetical protein